MIKTCTTFFTALSNISLRNTHAECWETMRRPENHEPDAKDLQTSSVFSNTSRSLRNRRKFLHVTGERRQTLSEHESVFQFILKSLFSALFFLTFIGWQDPQPGNLNKILPSSFPFVASSISADLQESYTWRMFESMKSKLRMRYPETRHRCGG